MDNFGLPKTGLTVSEAELMHHDANDRVFGTFPLNEIVSARRVSVFDPSSFAMLVVGVGCCASSFVIEIPWTALIVSLWMVGLFLVLIGLLSTFETHLQIGFSSGDEKLSIKIDDNESEVTTFLVALRRRQRDLGFQPADEPSTGRY